MRVFDRAMRTLREEEHLSILCISHQWVSWVVEGGALQSAWPWHAGVLDPQGPIGVAERTILLNATAIMLAVVVPVILLTLVFAWWFRSGNHRARYLPDWSIRSTVAPIEVEVVSLDWKWLFIYPDQAVAAVNRLVVPAGTPIRFRLTSASVMNSFFVPQLGSQIYTMSHMVTRLNLQAERPGTYPGLSAQFSGDGFSDMRFDVITLFPELFSPRRAHTAGCSTPRATRSLRDPAPPQRRQRLAASHRNYSRP